MYRGLTRISLIWPYTQIIWYTPVLTSFFQKKTSLFPNYHQ